MYFNTQINYYHRMITDFYRFIKQYMKRTLLLLFPIIKLRKLFKHCVPSFTNRSHPMFRYQFYSSDFVLGDRELVLIREFITARRLLHFLELILFVCVFVCFSVFAVHSHSNTYLKGKYFIRNLKLYFSMHRTK